METVILVIHLLLALAIIGLVLVQRSEGGGLGIGQSGGLGNLAGAHAASSLLTRTTAILGACFFATSLSLAVLAADKGSQADSILKEEKSGKARAPVEGAQKPGKDKDGNKPADKDSQKAGGDQSGDDPSGNQPSVPISE